MIFQIAHWGIPGNGADLDDPYAEASRDKIFLVSAVLLWAALTAVSFAAYWEW